MSKQKIRVDIVSDVVCPWCIVGYKQLLKGLEAHPDIEAEVHWHPFELNPAMGPEGQELREHLHEKYGTTVAQSAAVRQRITDLGASLGFSFGFSEEMRIYNTFQAHQVLTLAAQKGLQTDLKLALFEAYFTHNRNISDLGVLIEVAEGVGLSGDEVREALESETFALETRTELNHWKNQGIRAVPAFVFEGKFLVSGAQESGTFSQVVERVMRERV